ncbi:hypothetical protein Tco_0835251 [Tanacetum coccineum]
MMMWPRDCSRAAEDRTIPLSIIAEWTKLRVKDVECLLMKSLSQRWRLTVGAGGAMLIFSVSFFIADYSMHIHLTSQNAAKMATNSGCGRGHANLLCIVPILSDVPEGTRVGAPCPLYKASKRFHSGRCGIDALAIFLA